MKWLSPEDAMKVGPPVPPILPTWRSLVLRLRVERRRHRGPSASQASRAQPRGPGGLAMRPGDGGLTLIKEPNQMKPDPGCRVAGERTASRAPAFDGRRALLSEETWKQVREASCCGGQQSPSLKPVWCIIYSS